MAFVEGHMRTSKKGKIYPVRQYMRQDAIKKKIWGSEKILYTFPHKADWDGRMKAFKVPYLYYDNDSQKWEEKLMYLKEEEFEKQFGTQLDDKFYEQAEKMSAGALNLAIKKLARRIDEMRKKSEVPQKSDILATKHDRYAEVLESKFPIWDKRVPEIHGYDPELDEG